MHPARITPRTPSIPLRRSPATPPATVFHMLPSSSSMSAQAARSHLGRTGSLLLSANLAYNSGYFSEPDNVVRQKAYATVDVSAEWRPVRRGPSVRFWVLNLTDADYFTSLATMPTVGVFQSPAAPRRFGVSISLYFLGQSAAIAVRL